MSVIDHSKATPYTFVSIEIIDDIKYEIMHTVTRGPADSRIINYEIRKIDGEEIGR
tara:strand:- start:2393 stop:2560 length:168 start_codon:yes stop_codon:yes gene_type:complete